jgi:hypothetical protein
MRDRTADVPEFGPEASKLGERPSLRADGGTPNDTRGSIPTTVQSTKTATRPLLR